MMTWWQLVRIKYQRWIQQPKRKSNNKRKTSFFLPLLRDLVRISDDPETTEEVLLAGDATRLFSFPEGITIAAAGEGLFDVGVTASAADVIPAAGDEDDVVVTKASGGDGHGDDSIDSSLITFPASIKPCCKIKRDFIS